MRVVDETEAPAVRKISPLPRATKAGRSESRPSRPISTNGASFGAGGGSQRAGSMSCYRRPPTMASTTSTGGTAGTGSPVRRRSG